MNPGELADRLERHEEYSNAEMARRIGGEVWDRGDALVIFSRAVLGAGLNFACRIRSDEASIEALLDEIVVWFAARHVSPQVRVSPMTRPANVIPLLQARGFVQTEAETQMALAAEDAGPPANPRVSVEKVGRDEVDRWAAIQNIGFGGDGNPGTLFAEMARAAASSPGTTLYLARLDGEPACAGTLTAWESVHGIYGVATLPDRRGQGVATALVRHLVRAARAHGDAPVCLQVQTGTATQRWYERLGFRVVYDRTGWGRTG